MGKVLEFPKKEIGPKGVTFRRIGGRIIPIKRIVPSANTGKVLKIPARSGDGIRTIKNFSYKNRTDIAIFSVLALYGLSKVTIDKKKKKK